MFAVPGHVEIARRTPIAALSQPLGEKPARCSVVELLVEPCLEKFFLDHGNSTTFYCPGRVWLLPGSPTSSIARHRGQGYIPIGMSGDNTRPDECGYRNTC